MELFPKAFSTASAINRHEINVEDFSTVTLVMVNGTTAGSGVTGVFEASPDAVSKEAGAWVPIVGQRSNNQNVLESGFTSQAISAFNYGWTFNVAGYKRFRYRQTAISTGGYNALVAASKVPTTFAPINALSLTGSLPGVLGSPASGTMTKFEDAAAASGDTGVGVFGVRVPATPAAQTSAAGDWGTFAITAEGKQVPAGQGAEELTWQSLIYLTTTADTVVRSAAAAGIRYYVTDVIVDNQSAGTVRVSIKDGANGTILSVTVPANSSIPVSLKTPVRGSAATALNVAASVANAATVTTAGYVGV